MLPRCSTQTGSVCLVNLQVIKDAYAGHWEVTFGTFIYDVIIYYYYSSSTLAKPIQVYYGLKPFPACIGQVAGYMTDIHQSFIAL